MQKRFLVWLLFFLGFLLIWETLSARFGGGDVLKVVELVSVDSDYVVDQLVELKLSNRTDYQLALEDDCPEEPLDVYYYTDGEWQPVHARSESVACENVVDLVEPHTDGKLNFGPWFLELFSKPGKYKVEALYSLLTPTPEEGKVLVEFTVSERGVFRAPLYAIFYRPLYNFLVFLSWVSPGRNFGVALLVLTFLIRLILLVPNHKALKSQRAMQKIQPELEAIKRKFAGDQQKIGMETMALWKRHRVSPLNSCLPMLVQLPILLALYYVVLHGITEYSSPILYSFLDVDLSAIDMNFLGILDLRAINSSWLPVLVGMLQFGQMKLAFAKPTTASSSIVDVGEVKKTDSSTPPDPMKTMQTMMVYVMPVVIAVMTATLPSGVGLYWGVTTLFGLVQQVVVNRSK